jgi:glycosyltransferase involved in cell wall biosynthesis
MRLAFMDRSGWNFHVESPYLMPLGGSHSALCYLAEHLAQANHEVFVVTYTTAPGIYRGVHCMSLLQNVEIPSLDAVIMLNDPFKASAMREQLGPRTRLILWTQHAHDLPAMQPLRDPLERDAFDAIVVISEWQREQFCTHFDIAPERTFLLRNAIGPSFQGVFSATSSILAQKTQPPVLAYTSTPYRGLAMLMELFPRIRRAVPGTTLRVFSSLQVYQISATDDERNFGPLYKLCRETEGVEYVGSLSQPDLARELRSVSVLAYPNTYAETGCIAAMEAMASGCWIVTSDLGALPETTAGFGRLIPITGNDRAGYKDRFVEATVQVLQTMTSQDSPAAEEHLRRQVDHVNRSVTWSVRAREWTKWLAELLS